MMLWLNEETKTNNPEAPKMEESFRATLNETKRIQDNKNFKLGRATTKQQA